MVVFTCNNCGETLHKPKVEKHYQFTCRNYKSVTCVDCFKDFRDDDYVGHVKCITEDERYAAKGTYINGIVKKGEAKQESWLEMIKSICEAEQNLKPSVRNLLDTISEYSNVPRKKQKFINFIRSSSGNRANMKEVEEVWDIIEKYKVKKSVNNQKTAEITSPDAGNPKLKNVALGSEKQSKKRPISNDNPEGDSPKKKITKCMEEIAEDSSQSNNYKTTNPTGGKQKLESFKGTKQIFVEENGNNLYGQEKNLKIKKSKQFSKQGLDNSIESAKTLKDSTESSKFNFKEKILEILREKQSISHKKLQKKILKSYVNTTRENDCEEKIIKKFNKKLKKIPNVGIEDNRVVLQ